MRGILIIATCLTIIGCKKQEQRSEASSLGRKLYSIKSRNSNDHALSQTLQYDSYGRMIREITMDEDTGQEITQHFSYNETRLVKAEIRGPLKVLGLMEYLFDGKILGAIKYGELNKDGQITPNFSLQLTYDDEQIQRISYFEDTGALNRYELYRIESGNATQISSFNANGKFTGKVKYTFDERKNPYLNHPGYINGALGHNKANVIAEEVYNEDGVKIRSGFYAYEYHSSGLPLRKYAMDRGKKNIIATFGYLKDGLKVN